ncbi:Galactosylgalactosylxylosylprotein 3-beta-glucuronosyltransferase P [Portunus trituberculatus]|uniref:Galactosylgalactosylxylosylprotein 3-beta-glucuronosyltransferase n=1 Tax=Portunus trituberculatus TaxID=210409 RepID=A0A5B7E0Q1_PORTR|nr:Galactosylgalactosylxylosylprotein 3-beta-glucuronosyltransferase P [Portunus trituberculatus]
MPEEYRNQTMQPKGVANRNGGLAWVRAQATEGVVFFADDDNAYDLRLFEEYYITRPQMRYTSRVSMWPVGLISGSGVSSPVLRNGRLRPDATMPFKPGHEEDGFLKSLGTKPSDIEFKAAECTQIYVWHTQTRKNRPYSRQILSPKFDGTNLRVLQKDIMLQPGVWILGRLNHPRAKLELQEVPHIVWRGSHHTSEGHGGDGPQEVLREVHILTVASGPGPTPRHGAAAGREGEHVHVQCCSGHGRSRPLPHAATRSRLHPPVSANGQHAVAGSAQHQRHTRPRPRHSPMAAGRHPVLRPAVTRPPTTTAPGSHAVSGTRAVPWPAAPPGSRAASSGHAASSQACPAPRWESSVPYQRTSPPGPTTFLRPTAANSATRRSSSAAVAFHRRCSEASSCRPSPNRPPRPTRTFQPRAAPCTPRARGSGRARGRLSSSRLSVVSSSAARPDTASQASLPGAGATERVQAGRSSQHSTAHPHCHHSCVPRLQQAQQVQQLSCRGHPGPVRQQQHVAAASQIGSQAGPSPH